MLIAACALRSGLAACGIISCLVSVLENNQGNVNTCDAGPAILYRTWMAGVGRPGVRHRASSIKVHLFSVLSCALAAISASFSLSLIVCTNIGSSISACYNINQYLAAPPPWLSTMAETGTVLAQPQLGYFENLFRGFGLQYKLDCRVLAVALCSGKEDSEIQAVARRTVRFF